MPTTRSNAHFITMSQSVIGFSNIGRVGGKVDIDRKNPQLPKHPENTLFGRDREREQYEIIQRASHRPTPALRETALRDVTAQRPQTWASHATRSSAKKHHLASTGLKSFRSIKPF